MRLLLAQIDMAWEDKSANLAIVERTADAAAAEKCDILVLPEMTLTGFSMNTDLTAEEPGGMSERSFAQIAASRRTAVLAGLVERRSEGAANIAALFDASGAVVAKYAKTRLFPLSGETAAHLPGDGLKVFEAAGAASSAAICYDLRFPELFRAVAASVEVIYVIANWPSVRADHWTALLRARAIENQCFVVGVNRTGADPDGTSYSGGSAVFAPDGAEPPPVSFSGGFPVFEIDPSVVEEHRRRYPFLP